MDKHFRNYVIFWASQSVSQLGSSMTAFAFILWQYMQTRSAMAVALMSFCNYMAYVLLSTVSGSIVDRHDKKTVILLSDSAAAAATLLIFLLTRTGSLHTWHVCAANAWIGAAAAFQSPASSVVIGKLVPAEKLTNAGGMAVMFLCTGTIGACFSFLAYRQQSIQAIRKRCFSPPVIK